jgi:hypothetical protein
MRTMRSLTQSVLAPSSRQDRIWLPSLPHVLAGCATLPVFGGSACVLGLLLASLASFIIYLPLIALALNGGAALTPETPAPDLTPVTRVVLLGLWTATAWVGAGLAAMAG